MPSSHPGMSPRHLQRRASRPGLRCPASRSSGGKQQQRHSLQDKVADDGRGTMVVSHHATRVVQMAHWPPLACNFWVRCAGWVLAQHPCKTQERAPAYLLLLVISCQVHNLQPCYGHCSLHWFAIYHQCTDVPAQQSGHSTLLQLRLPQQTSLALFRANLLSCIRVSCFASMISVKASPRITRRQAFHTAAVHHEYFSVARQLLVAS